MRAAVVLIACLIPLALTACGDSDSSSGDGAACTKEALTEGVQASGDETVEVLDGFVCEDGWAAGPYLVGTGSEQVEAAFLVKDENGSWKSPASPPCEDGDIPDKVLDVSPCRVS